MVREDLFIINHGPQGKIICTHLLVIDGRVQAYNITHKHYEKELKSMSAKRKSRSEESGTGVV